MYGLTSKMISVIEEGVMPLLLLSQRCILFFIILFFHNGFVALRRSLFHLPLLKFQAFFCCFVVRGRILASLRSVSQFFHEICASLFVFFDDKPNSRRIDMEFSSRL